jgi:4-amino-4-deoxy-L-arabinose transferase-like glycosyltransferase
MGLFIVGYLSDNNRKKLLCYILVYVSCSLAFFTKGFIGVVIPGLGILAFLVADRNIKEIFKMRLWLGALIFLVMTLPWFIALWHQGGTENLNVFLIHNHLRRFIPGSFSREASGHHHPFYYYLIEFPVGFLPWSLLLIPVVAYAFSKTAESHAPWEKGLLFAKCWFFAGIIFLSVASTKRTLYLMPIFAPIAMLTAMYISSTLTSQSLNRIGKFFLWVFAIVLLLIGVGTTPVYVYVKGIYPWIAGTNLFSLVAILSLFMVTFSIAAIWFLWHRNLQRYWTASTAPIIAGLLFAAVVVAPLMDRHKSFVPFCQEVQATVPHDQTFFAYSPDETLRGAVPFYTGHYLVEINGLDSLEDIMQREESFFVMTRDKRRKAEGELLSTGGLFVVFQEKMGIDRTLMIFSKNATMALSKIKLSQTLAYKEVSR